MKALLALLFLCPTISFAEYEKEEFKALVRENLPKFWQCYEESPAYKAGTQGKLVIQITLGSKGEVTAAKAVVPKSSFHDPVVESCVTTKLKSMNFPAPPPDEEVEINYPFIFTIKKEAAKPAEKPAEVKTETKAEEKK